MDTTKSQNIRTHTRKMFHIHILKMEFKMYSDADKANEGGWGQIPW